MRFLAGLGIRPKRTSPVVVSVAEILNEIFAASQGVWRTRSTGKLLSRIFHESIAELFRAGPRNWTRALTPADFAETGLLERHIYEYFVAYRLMRYQGALKESTGDILQFWTAMKEWCEWFRGVVRSGLEEGDLKYHEESSTWTGGDRLVEPDRHLRYTFEDPGWTAPVMIQGRADSLMSKPGSQDWYMMEYRAGTGATEADLAQAVMFRLMLDVPDAALVWLVRFNPEARQVSYTSDELRTGLELLKPILARIAGVLPEDGEAVMPGNEEEPFESRVEAATAGAQSLELVRVAPSPAVGMDVTGDKIVSVCKEFGADVTLVGVPAAGSAFVRYQLNPDQGVSARKVAALALDLQVRLGLESSPLIRVDRGKLAIDVPRRDRQGVTFSSVKHQLPRTEVSSRVPLGIDMLGSLKFADLANPVSAHMLVAGTTGSGKTEWLRMVIAGLILQNTPASLRFALIDPKGGAFSDWQTSPFLWHSEASVSPTRNTSVLALLDGLIEEMERRYKAMEEEGVDDIARLAAKSQLKWPRIVCICDEYADLVVDRSARRDVESRIARLGSKARAAGIHLIIATQRPSRDIVEGTLKANLSAKVALRVNSSIESRLVLGVNGAESLLGEGDLLYQDAGVPVRLQAALLSLAERAELSGAAPVAGGAV